MVGGEPSASVKAVIASLRLNSRGGWVKTIHARGRRPSAHQLSRAVTMGPASDLQDIYL